MAADFNDDVAGESEALDLQRCLVILNEVQFFLDGGQSNDRSMPLRARINHESSPLGPGLITRVCALHFTGP